MINKLQYIESGQNCEDVELHFLLPSIPAEPANTKSSDDDKEILHSVTAALAKDEFDVDLDANVDEASSYVTGHGIQRVIFCEDCKNSLRKTSSSDSFIFHKTYDETCQLYDPRDEVVSDVLTLKSIIFKLLQQIASRKNLSSTISSVPSVPSVQTLFSYKFVSSSCRENVQMLLRDFFIRFFIKLYCIRKHEQLTDVSQQKRRKYKKLIL